MLGEETVLLAALEGRRGQPEQRPPYPTERGLFGHPTLVHNVATLATVPWIVTNGADAFRAIGDPDAPGTVLVGVSGAVANPGIVEVPTGTTLRELVDLAGGVAAGHTFKAALVGGPTGGLLPAELLDTPYSFDALRATGAHVGSGGVVIADERACIVDLARLLVRYGADEACGKTIPCRIGLRRLAEIGQRYADGTARPTDPKLLADLADDCAASALCDHERLAPVSAPDRDAILRSRDRRPHPPGRLPRRRLQPDPAGSRRHRKVGDDRTMADLISRPADIVSVDPPRAGRRQPRRAPLPDPGAAAPAVDARHPAGGRRAARRGPRGPDDPGGLPRQRDRDPDPLLRAQAAGLRRLPDVRRGGGGRGAPADLVLARGRGRDGGPDPDRGDPADPADEPRADLLATTTPTASRPARTSAPATSTSRAS